MEDFIACLAEVTDPRQDNARHNLHEILREILMIALCGGEECSDMPLFGQAREPFLRQFLTLRHGIPRGLVNGAQRGAVPERLSASRNPVAAMEPGSSAAPSLSRRAGHGASGALDGAASGTAW